MQIYRTIKSKSEEHREGIMKNPSQQHSVMLQHHMQKWQPTKSKHAVIPQVLWKIPNTNFLNQRVNNTLEYATQRTLHPWQRQSEKQRPS